MKSTFEQIETIYDTLSDSDQIELLENSNGQIKCSITDEDSLEEVLIIEKDGTII